MLPSPRSRRSRATIHLPRHGVRSDCQSDSLSRPKPRGQTGTCLDGKRRLTWENGPKSAVHVPPGEAWGSRGRRFKSCHPDSVFAGQRAVPALTSSGGAALELSACRPRVGRAERDGRPGGKGQPSNVQEPVESLEPSPRHRRPLCFLELRPLRSAPFTAPGGRILGAACGAATPSGLAITGVQLNTLLAAIVVLVGVGAGLTVVARRRLQV